jgi:hypothetical protein
MYSTPRILGIFAQRPTFLPVFNTFAQLNSCLETYFLVFRNALKLTYSDVYFQKFSGRKPPDPRPKGRPRLTRRGARLMRGGIGDGREGKEGKGERERAENPRICMLPTPMVKGCVSTECY